MNIIDFIKNVVHNLSAADLTVLAGLLATGAHYIVTKYQSVAKIVNWLLALIFPFVTTLALLVIHSGSELKLYPWAVVVAQTVYQVVEWIKRNAVPTVSETVVAPPSNPSF